MPSLFPTTFLSPGHGIIQLSLLPPSYPTFSALSYSYPLKLLPSAPHHLDPSSLPSDRLSTTTVPLLFILTYGGGLVAGDEISISIRLDSGTRLTVVTQGSTKIFKAPHHDPTPSQSVLHQTSNDPQPLATDHPSSSPPTTTQTLHVSIAPHSSLWLGPDPTTPFATSRYAQKQIFNIEKGGSVGFVDWVSEGRTARGERWAFEKWRGRNEIWTSTATSTPLGGICEEGRTDEGPPTRRLLIRDSVILEGEEIAVRVDNMAIFGTLILHGPIFSPLSTFLLDEFNLLPRIGGRNWGPDPTEGEAAVEEDLTPRQKWRQERLTREARDGVLWTAARRRGCTIVKFAAGTVEGGRVWLGGMLREEGSVGREFGEGGLMGMR